MADEPQQSRLSHALRELKHRKVFRTAAAYLVVAWLLAQVGDVVLDPFGAPAWVQQVWITVLVLGFAPAVALAWMFDLSRGGVRRSPGSRLFRSAWFRAAVALPVVGATAVAVWWVWDDTAGALVQRIRSPAVRDTPTVAVGEISNLTGEDSLSWLGEGLASLLRNGLAESRHLIVVSRTRWESIVRGATQRNSSADRAAAVAGIDYLLSGEYLSSPSGLILTVRLSDLANGTDMVPQRLEDLGPESLLESAGRLVSATKQALRVPHTESVQVFAADFRVDNLAAYEAYLSGLEYFHRFGYEQAERAFRAALQLQPDFHIARYRLAHVLWVRGRTEAALEMIAGIPGVAPLTPRERLYVEGARALFNRDYEAAKAVYRRFLDQYPFEVEARQFLAEVHWQSYEEKEAVAQLERLLEQEQENEALWSYLGETWLDLGRLDEAQRALDRYLALAPEDPFGFAVLGDLHQLRGDPRQAIDFYRQALSREATFRPAQLGLARSFATAGREQEAEGRLRQLAADTNAAPAYRIDAAFDLAEMLRSRGRFAEAAQALEALQTEIAEEKIRESLALATRGLCHMELRQWDEASALIDQAIERAVLAPTRYLFARGLLELQRGDVTAVGSTAAAIRQHALPAGDPDRTEDKAAAFLEGMALLSAGRPSEARARLAVAVHLDGYRYGIYQLGLARAAAAAGEYAIAADLAARAASDHDPDDLRWDLELDRTRARLLEARIRIDMGEVEAGRRLAREFLGLWRQAPADHPDLVLARQLIGTS